ncbi:hypothetical protein [Vibrio coralliirubri]|uniref:hypothetical protein n=1 Tax=Vibrio coralliirubri TaxID=1516159 RepID=UPI000A38C5D1|nr:hypothetical protein [Vibrio coralliirubri]
MLIRAFKRLFPKTFLNVELARYNTEMMDLMFGENARHKRIAKMFNYDRAIRMIVKSHNSKTSEAGLHGVRVAEATGEEKIFLSMIMVARHFLGTKCRIDHNLGAKYLMRLHTMITNSLESGTVATTPLLAYIIEYLKLSVEEMEA